MNKLLSIETFVGAGGSYLGLKKAGFKTIYVNEIDKNFAKTLTSKSFLIDSNFF